MQSFYYLIFVVLLAGTPQLSYALNNKHLTDTSTKHKDTLKFRAIEIEPQYPGGVKKLFKFISKNLKYPEVAKLIGINGKVNVQFVIDQYGNMVEITPVSCIGAGCESEAVNVLSLTEKWTPGLMDGKPVRVQYTLPISFNIDLSRVSMKDLRKSDFGFLFDIKGTIYTIDDAEKILGHSFLSNQIEIALPYADAEKYPMPSKKEVYLLKIKS